ncbi:thioredoxin-like fold domain-containing protein MRL7L homolog, chloroplastic [Zingiber officinale]|nr:thioredoxin-like fold domain-containing protein MRL7L homolog, chloroplastic [Zingiber officinale]XP_042378229.1 thioredoxin-like fold domain-containing protein MRL7L homolog, chloroplastic [Zingiber officinale]
MAAPHCSLLSSRSTRGPKEASGFYLPSLSSSSSSWCQRKHVCFGSPSSPRFGISLSKPLALAYASKAVELVLGDGKDEDDVSGWNPSERKTGEDEDCDDDEASLLMTEEEREEMRRQIRKVIDANPIVEEETDPDQRKIKMKKLLEKYPLVVEEDDPDWPEDSDGRGFNLDQFFNKITIKNVKKDEDDENYDSDKELVWQDDNYIRPIRDITSAEWEDTVFRDFNPLIILVHNRYKRPSENERARNELERAVQMFWQSGLPSPRCVAIDACVEHDLVDALQVSIFPEIIFTKAGKILYRDKVVRSGDDWSKMMAFFYYKAVRPSCLDRSADKNQEKIPSLS